KFL
ncbi:MAG: glyceraldehyde 3-phosphate dehydrogenase GapA, partial [Porphyrobacter sp. HL-46]